MGTVQGLSVVLLPREGAHGQPRCAVKVSEVGSQLSESNMSNWIFFLYREMNSATWEWPI